MGEILSAYLMPHPPIIIPEVGKGEQRKAQSTIEALETCARHIKDNKPHTVVLITPHGPMFRDAIAVMATPHLTGNFARFGAPGVKMSFENDVELAKAIMDHAERLNIPCIGIDNSVASDYRISTSMDWGALVPLYFVTKQYSDFKLVHITYAPLSYEALYAFGKAIQEAVRACAKDVCVIASGDLSHRLSQDGPYGFHPMGPKLDKEIMAIIESGDVERFFNMAPVMVEEGGECGLRSIIIAMGTLDGYDLHPRVLSYEGPFGVGYGVAIFERGKPDATRLFVERLFERKHQRMQRIRQNEDPYVRLARRSLESYIRTGKIIKSDDNLPREMLENRAGVFVSIKKDGQLRGCIGTIEPTRKNIAEEIIYNAISAGVHDPRFIPVDENELEELVYSVDVLKKPEPVKSIDELDAKRYGVIVRSGHKSGLLLPDLEGVDTPQQQIEIALRKAGIRPNESYTIERFEVERHK
ncbi:AmmeMemoRadiSam system protein A [Caldicoprobacter guelmensis]|uniref:AmmeMemoRadiSam system protein A n=1 Tax=Caldicoprobacter guelmensis TaxID=1170224 RepID=UPI00195A1C41|nr:AmmeMemoRadiSam system protein A [Caldicoprobacter guelmensis]MBM7581597.1 AmmeMemoRadiSam system protein A [Caldicoprobacter guelmensis]